MTREEKFQFAKLSAKVDALEKRLLAIEPGGGKHIIVCPDVRRIFEQVIAAVCEEFAIRREQLLSRARPDFIAFPRMACYALVFERAHSNWSELGRLFNRDHGAIMNGVQVFANRTKQEPRLAAKIAAVRARLAATPLPMKEAA